MSETKKAAISLLVAALVFVLTAFSSAQALGKRVPHYYMQIFYFSCLKTIAIFVLL